MKGLVTGKVQKLLQGKALGHFLAIITMTIWSSTFVVSKSLLVSMTPLQLLFLRYVIAIIFLTAIYPKFKKPESIKEEVLFFLIGGCLAVYFILENSALELTFATNVSLIDSTIPLITGLLTAIFYKKRIFNFKSSAGFTIAYLGVFIIITNGNSISGLNPLGDILVLIAAVIFAFYTILMQRITSPYHLIQMTRKVFIYALIIICIIFLVTGESLKFGAFNTRMVIGLGFLGIIASGCAFLMWNKAIKIIGSVKTNLYIYLGPITTTIFATLTLGEKVTVFTIIGTAMILSGLFLSEKGQKG